jgi:hypothetical protein
MTACSPTLRRRGPARLLPLLVLPLLCPLLASGAAAQVPPDSMVVDTLRAPVPDTLPPGGEPQDTLPPARPLVRFPLIPPAPVGGAGSGEWVWDHAALLREGPVSLIDLLERIPGIATYRGGMFVQPEAASAFGGTTGRVEIEIDGFILDPLAAPTLDLAQIPLGQLREVRVERRLGLLRIRLVTDSPDNEQPYTRIEAGIGVPPANLFRGIFLVPHVIVGPLGLAIERLDTDGSGRAEPADAFSGWAKWAWTSDTRGVQLEIWRTTLRRAAPWPVDRVRQDIIVRARNTFAPGLVAEVYAGRSVLDETLPPPPAGDTLAGAVDPDRDNLQLGARALYRLPQASIGAALKYRSAVFLPSMEATLDADVRLGPARFSGELSHAAWREQDGATYFGLRGEVRPVDFAGVFAEITGGRRGAPLPGDTLLRSQLTERSGWRAGIAASIGQRATGSVALIDLRQDRARPFGLPFDSVASSLYVEPARGIEAHGRLVIWPGWFAVDSWITEWSRSPGWAYMPARSWRTALELHTLPLPSGNLEILGRLEAAHRSGVLAFQPEPPVDGDATVALPGVTQLNGYLHIRVHDVRAYIGMEDMLGQLVEELPGRILRGPRLFYGVKWHLWN